VMGCPLLSPHPQGPKASPGMLTSHYAPHARVRRNAATAEPGEVLLGFGPEAPADAMNLSPSGALDEAAANLFAMLRALDARAEAIAVMPIPSSGLGEAINDRLKRAAAPRAQSEKCEAVFGKIARQNKKREQTPEPTEPDGDQETGKGGSHV